MIPGILLFFSFVPPLLAVLTSLLDAPIRYHVTNPDAGSIRIGKVGPVIVLVVHPGAEAGTTINAGDEVGQQLKRAVRRAAPRFL